MMGDLALGVDACIGSAGDDAGDRLAAIQAGGGLFQQFLNGQAVDLTLPADEPVPSYSSSSAQRVMRCRSAGLRQGVPDGRAGNAAASRAAAAGELDFGQPDRPAAACDAQGVVEHAFRADRICRQARRRGSSAGSLQQREIAGPRVERAHLAVDEFGRSGSSRMRPFSAAIVSVHRSRRLRVAAAATRIVEGVSRISLHRSRPAYRAGRRWWSLV